ncbi:MAG: hypothetical protein Q7R34_05320 [Dehalococcoidia bacterium]|nr:hypothetical protein [Dehalococcoidia bacterium]
MDELTALSTEDLLSRLRKAEVELEDIEELSRGILGGTGIHVSFREMKRARHLYEDMGGELRVQIDLFKKILKERGVQS